MFATPELLLRWRDTLRSTALVVTDAPTFSAVAALARIRPAIAPACIGFALFLLGALAWRRRRLARGSAAGSPVALLAVGPIAVLLWFGVGSADTTSIEAAAFIVCCVLLWLLHERRVQMRVLGDAAAWRDAAFGSLLLAPFLLALLLANLLDADGLRLRPIPADRFWFYPLWALLQQYLLLRVIAPRTRTPGRSAEAGAVLAGLLFALLHLPNFGLMLATFVAGTLWAWLGYRHRALLPLAASHALLGLMLVIVAPDWLLRSAEIGGRYLLPP